MKETTKQDMVVLITGAGKGIGRAVAETLARRAEAAGSSLSLYLAARTRSDLESLKAQLDSSVVRCDLIAGDLAETPTEPVEACLARHGRIDALIHSAGVGRLN